MAYETIVSTYERPTLPHEGSKITARFLLDGSPWGSDQLAESGKGNYSLAGRIKKRVKSRLYRVAL